MIRRCDLAGTSTSTGRTGASRPGFYWTSPSRMSLVRILAGLVIIIIIIITSIVMNALMFAITALLLLVVTRMLFVLVRVEFRMFAIALSFRMLELLTNCSVADWAVGTAGCGFGISSCLLIIIIRGLLSTLDAVGTRVLKGEIVLGEKDFLSKIVLWIDRFALRHHAAW